MGTRPVIATAFSCCELARGGDIADHWGIEYCPQGALIGAWGPCLSTGSFAAWQMSNKTVPALGTIPLTGRFRKFDSRLPEARL